MVNAAIVLMILGGVLGSPAVLCFSLCTGTPGAAATGHTVTGVITALGWIASAGSIILGALVKPLGKVVSGVGAISFAVFFALLLLQANPLGMLSAPLLLIAAILIFVAPESQFRTIVPVEKG